MSIRKWATGSFWSDAFERAVRTAAQVAVAALGVGSTGIFAIDWAAIASLAGGAAVLSLLTSLAAGGTGDPATAGFATHADVHR